MCYCSGIDHGSYAQELMKNCEKIVVESKDTAMSNPVEVLTRSAAETESPGSSTVLVACFDGQVWFSKN